MFIIGFLAKLTGLGLVLDDEVLVVGVGDEAVEVQLVLAHPGLQDLSQVGALAVGTPLHRGCRAGRGS